MTHLCVRMLLYTLRVCACVCVCARVCVLSEALVSSVVVSCSLCFLTRCGPDVRRQRSRGQPNYFLVERCLRFDSPIAKVAGVLRVLLGVWGVRRAPIKEVLIGACSSTRVCVCVAAGRCVCVCVCVRIISECICANRPRIISLFCTFPRGRWSSGPVTPKLSDSLSTASFNFGL